MKIYVDKIHIKNVVRFVRHQGRVSAPIKKTDCWVLLFVEKGTLRLKLEGNDLAVFENSLLLMSKKSEAAIDSVETVSSEYVIVKFDYSPDNFSMPLGLFDLSGHPQYALCVRQLLMERRFKALFFEDRRRMALADLIIGLRRLGKDRMKISGPFSPSIAKAIHFIHARLKGRISMGELSRQTGYSPHHFYLLFKKETGLSPKQYLAHVKLRRAKDLLAESQLNVSQIAGECGFPEIFDFSHWFKKASGLSPRAFRKTIRV